MKCRLITLDGFEKIIEWSQENREISFASISALPLNSDDTPVLINKRTFKYIRHEGEQNSPVLVYEEVAQPFKNIERTEQIERPEITNPIMDLEL